MNCCQGLDAGENLWDAVVIGASLFQIIGANQIRAHRKVHTMLLSEYHQPSVGLANAALARIVKLHNDRDSTALRPPSDLLYHYTNADGLKGIVENNELWATSAYFLNDSAEIYYGCDLLKYVIDDWVTKNPRPENSLSLGFVRQLRTWFGEHLIEKHVVPPVYVACFCEDDNLLSQWRTYGQTGGYSVGFRVPIADYLGLGFRPEPNTYTTKWAKIEYERDEQIHRCAAILNSVLAILDDPNTAQAIIAIGEHPFAGYSKISRVVSDILLEEIVSFKNEAFKAEQEWRVIVRARELTKQGTDDGGITPVPVHFRALRGMLAPYVRLVPTDPTNKLPIACVRTGPTLDKIAAGMGVYMMLEKNGYPHLRVQGSEISVRF